MRIFLLKEKKKFYFLLIMRDSFSCTMQQPIPNCSHWWFSYNWEHQIWFTMPLALYTVGFFFIFCVHISFLPFNSFSFHLFYFFKTHRANNNDVRKVGSVCVRVLYIPTQDLFTVLAHTSEIPNKWAVIVFIQFFFWYALVFVWVTQMNALVLLLLLCFWQCAGCWG